MVSVLDAHVHFAVPDPSVAETLRGRFRLLNICVAYEDRANLDRQRSEFRGLADRYPEVFSWCTSFMPPAADSPADWASETTAMLRADIVEGGAAACKLWKNVGMSVRKADGSFLMPDDPVLDPVYEELGAAGIPLIVHCGEPRQCWEPLPEKGPHVGYYRNNPEWHMYGRGGFPSHGNLVAAMDRMLGRHPRLTVVGAHLGSVEYDVDALAERLGRFANLHVDTSARHHDLAVQDPRSVTRFFDRQRDRVLYGSDFVQYPGYHGLETALDRYLAMTAERDLRFLGSEEAVSFDGDEYPGLGLAPEILDLVLCGNAERLFAL